MSSDKDTPPTTEDEPKKETKVEPQAPADALSLTPDELEEEKAEQAAASIEESEAAANQPTGEKKLSPLKRFFRKVNLYFLIFLLLIVVTGILTLVNYLNSQKVAPEPNIAAQGLTEDALKQLANTDATVGNTSQTLTIQGNAIITGQTLMRGNLNVAGNLQTGGTIQAPSITISGAANLGTTQINSLQVATNTAIQGSTTLRDLNVAGTSSFSGAVTAGQITVTKLIISGNGVLEIPNHISFTGSTPSRSVNNAVLGNGGTLSLNGSDTAGTINISSGNSPTAGCFAQITFQQAYTTSPRVTVTPVGPVAGQLDFYVTRNTTSFSICTANAAQGNQTFSFDYFITN